MSWQNGINSILTAHFEFSRVVGPSQPEEAIQEAVSLPQNTAMVGKFKR